MMTTVEREGSVTGPHDLGDLGTRAKALGLNPPKGICFLPTNIDTAISASDLQYDGDVATLRVLFRHAEVDESPLEPKEVRIPMFRQKNVDLVIPALCVTTALLSEHSNVVNVALGVVANYATDFFKGMGGNKRIRFSIVINDTEAGRYSRFEYVGDPSGIKDFAKLATRLTK